MRQLSALEAAAIKAVLQEADDEAVPLRNNLKSLQVAKREITDHGFQTWFETTCQPSQEIKRKLVHNDVFAEIEGLPEGAGFILHLDSGKIKSLECVCYGNAYHSSDFSGKFAIHPSHVQVGR